MNTGGIKNWLAPLTVFVVGELVFLLFLIFMPAVDTGAAATASATANITSTFHGWSWMMTTGVARTLAMGGYQVALFITVGVLFLKSKS